VRESLEDRASKPCRVYEVPRSDDVLVTVLSGDADYNPKIITRTTATVLLTVQTQVFVTHSYSVRGPRTVTMRSSGRDSTRSTLVAVGAVTDSVDLQLNIKSLPVLWLQRFETVESGWLASSTFVR
jgi:hypothetical protein